MNQFKTIAFLFVFIALQTSGSPAGTEDTLKPRIVVLTDVSTWETDDSESLVRLMVYADRFEIEGIIYTTGWSLEETRDDFFSLIHDAIDAYEKDLPNLKRRSAQTGFRPDESRQELGYWPSPEYLRSRTVFGSRKRGLDKLGKDNVSDGSNLIIKLADEDDDRPLWILLWGGGNTLAQAVWQIQQERDADGLKAFLQKIPTYAITDQDRPHTAGTPFDISAHQWLRKEFEKDLMFLWDECAWKFQNGAGRDNWAEYEKQIQSHGNLGKVYPKYKYGVEGDTPSFLHVMPNGLNNPLDPTQAGWGGIFEWGKGPDESTYSYNNHTGKIYQVCRQYETRFYPATFNDFAARMDWADSGKGNRNPVVIINRVKGIEPIEIETKPGKKVVLDASKSFDPENDKLTYKWSIQPEAGTYPNEMAIDGETSARITLEIPRDFKGKTLHVICEVTDDGTPNLTSYRRIILFSK